MPAKVQLRKSDEEGAAKKKAFILMMPERMEKCKLTLNQERYMNVDIKTEGNELTSNLMNIKCSILTGIIQEQTDFLIFKSKLLQFKIRVTAKD